MRRGGREVNAGQVGGGHRPGRLEPAADVGDGHVHPPAHPVVDGRDEIGQRQDCQHNQAEKSAFQELLDVGSVHGGIVPEEKRCFGSQGKAVTALSFL